MGGYQGQQSFGGGGYGRSTGGRGGSDGGRGGRGGARDSGPRPPRGNPDASVFVGNLSYDAGES